MGDILMPRLSEDMDEGKFLMWSVKVGDRVKVGDSIAEVETDKANMEIESLEDGTIGELIAQPGETYPVGATLGRIKPCEK